MNLTQKLFDEAYRLNRPQYEDDVRNIYEEAYRLGVLLDTRQAEDVWKYYSESMGAIWVAFTPERVAKALKIFIAHKLHVNLEQEILDNPL